MNKKQKGAYGEFLARLVLRLKGYRILQKNYITGRGVGAGEIDIIAQKGRCIVFVEVKERKTKENALYAIKPEQQKRIIRAARNYIAKHKAYQNFDVRFDAVLVSNFCLTHIKNAWSL